MRSLLKADFFALFKSKITYVVFFICVGFPFLMLLLYFGIAKSIEDIAGESGPDLYSALGFNAKSIMFSIFSLTQNIGLVIPVFAGIITMADMRNGTVRNKVIIGKNRTKIYFSHLIVTTLFCVVMISVSFLILCGGSLILFEYGSPFKGAEVGHFFKILASGLLTFAFIGSVTSFFSLGTKSMPMTIIFTIILSFILGLAGMILSTFVEIIKEQYRFIVYLIPTFASTYGITLGEIPNNIFFYGLGSIVFFYCLNTVLGLLLFNKTDLK